MPIISSSAGPGGWGAGAGLVSPTPQAACAELIGLITNSPWPSQQALAEHIQNPNSNWRVMHRARLDSIFRSRGRSAAGMLEKCLTDGLMAAHVPTALAIKSLLADFMAIAAQYPPPAPAPSPTPGLPPGPVPGGVDINLPSLPPGFQLPVPPSSDPNRPNGFPPPPGERPQPGTTVPPPPQSTGAGAELVPILIVAFSAALAAGGIGWWLGRGGR